MKLWQKATLACSAVLLVIVVFCSSILLLYVQQTVLNISREQVKTKQSNLAVSFSEMMNYYVSDTDTEIEKNSLLKYCFSRFADTSSVLAKNDDVLSSSVSVDPTKYLPFRDLPHTDEEIFVGEQRICETQTDGHDVLIVGSRVRVHNENYCIYAVEDVSDVHHSILTMMYVFMLVCLAGILIGAVTLALLIHSGAKPLAALSDVSKQIAGGKYDIRADIHSKDEIGALAEDFNTMAVAVQQHIAELSETAERQRLFIGGVTHEFKTPLTAMLLHAELLKDVNLTTEERAESLAHLEKQCEWLERLTQKLLKTIVLKDEITKNLTPARELIARVQASTQQVMANRGTVLETSCDDSSILVDADLMQSLLVNLVDNASKAYDPDDTNRTVWLTICENILEVCDAGRGIPADSLDHIFEPFYMVDKSRSKKNGGSGLGLALVKQIADAHGARLEVNSAPGKGTSVRVVL